MCSVDLFGARAALRYIGVIFLSALSLYAQPAPDKELIQAAGHPEIYLLVDGQKHHIHHPSWFVQNGFAGVPIRTLTTAEVDAIPESYSLPEGSGMPGKAGDMALTGKLLSDKDGRIYVVMKGKRHWILTNSLVQKNIRAHGPPVQLTDEQLKEIPLGSDITYISTGQKIAFIISFLGILAFLVYGLAWNGSTVARVAAAVIFIAAIGWREPYLLAHPRFWAEEGLVWFQYGSSHSMLETLFYVFPMSNYFNLTPNIGAILSSRTAAHFGLLYAPLGTTLLAYSIEAGAIIAILFLRSRLFDTFGKAIAGCMIVLFAPTTTDEIWLNSINSMSFWGLIAIALLFAETENWSKWTRWGMRATLLFCGFSSPYAAALLPMFLISAWRSRGREQKVQCLILLVCVLIQGGVVMESRTKLALAKEDPRRATVVKADSSAVNIFVEHMLYPSLGFSLREHILEWTGVKEASAAIISLSLPRRKPPTSLRASGWLCLFMVTGILIWLRGPTLFSTTNMVMGVFLVLSIFTCVASLYSVPTGRYAVLPGISFLFLLLMNTNPSNSQVHRYICKAVLACGLSAGMISYQTMQVQDGPSWAGEIQKWKADPNYSMRVWPSFFVAPVNITYPKPGEVKR